MRTGARTTLPVVARRDRKPNALIASGRKVRLGSPGVKLDLGLDQPWQIDAWDYWRKTPEVKQLMLFLGNQLGKLRLFLAVEDPDDPEGDPIPISDEKAQVPERIRLAAQAELDRLELHDGGLPELLRRLDLNLEIPGEGYLVGLGARMAGDPDPRSPIPDKLLEPGEELAEEWWVISRSAVMVTGSGDGARTAVKMHPGDSAGRRLDRDFDTIIRIYQADPEWPALADSAMQGVLFECRILMALTAQVLAVANSQMHAGILTIPNELSFGPASPSSPEEGDKATEDPLDQDLDDIFTEVVEHPDSLMTIRPTLLRGPGQYLSEQYVRYIQMGRQLDERLDGQIEQRVRRIARGLNAPVEAVEGHDATTFANAKQIDRDLFDDHIEPRATMLVRSLSSAYLQANLHDAAMGEPLIEGGPAPVVDVELDEWADRIIIWYDPSSIIREPDLEAHADAAHDRNAISDAAYRRAVGAGGDDAPEPLEIIIRTALRRGTLDPVITVALLREIAADAGVELPELDDLTGQGAAGQPETSMRVLAAALLLQERIHGQDTAMPSDAPLVLPPQLTASRSPEVNGPNPGAALLAIDVDLRTRLTVAASDAMERALERAGNRLRSKLNKTDTAAAAAGLTRGQIAQHQTLLRGLPPRLFARILGPELVAAVGVTEDELTGDPWGQLEPLFDAWVLAAQRRALDELETIVDSSVPDRSGLEARQDEDRDHAWGWFAAALTALLARRIYDPDPAAPELGEHDTSMTVPTGLVRATISQAGGAPLLEFNPEDLSQVGAVLADGGTRPVGGIGQGELILEQLRGFGVATKALKWVYGHSIRATFHPHLSLDAIVFRDYDDPRLVNGAGWPPFGHYFPGDHYGCRCDVELILTPPAGLVPMV